MRFVFKGFPVVGMIEINFVPTFMLKSTARCGRVVGTPTWYFGDIVSNNFSETRHSD